MVGKFPVRHTLYPVTAGMDAVTKYAVGKISASITTLIGHIEINPVHVSIFINKVNSQGGLDNLLPFEFSVNLNFANLELHT